jgi:glycine oxidase
LLQQGMVGTRSRSIPPPWGYKVGYADASDKSTRGISFSTSRPPIRLINPTNPSRRQLGLFAKSWRPGWAKTRLRDLLGTWGTARLYRNLLRHGLQQWATAGDHRLWLVDPEKDLAACKRFADRHAPQSWTLVAQGDGDLGQRLRRFFSQCLREGHRAIAIGADTPSLSPSLIDDAFEQLQSSPCVLGPSDDGGYYLIGLAPPIDERAFDERAFDERAFDERACSSLLDAIFEQMPWGTNAVATITEQRLEQLGLRASRLPTLADIDRPADLPPLRSQRRIVRIDDVLVVGGGAIGLSLAWQLAKRGQRVRLLDRGQTQQASSWTGAGILPPANPDATSDPLEQLRGLSHRLHRQWAKELQSITGIDVGYRPCGGLYIATRPGEAAALAAQSCWWAEHQIEAIAWPTDHVRDRFESLEPLCRSGRLLAAWWLPGEAQLRNPRYLRALRAAAIASGATIESPVEVDRLLIADHRAYGVAATTQTFLANNVCLCGGAWTRQLFDRLHLASGIVPIRGQMLLYRCHQPPLPCVLNEGHRYIVPRDDGHVLVGSNEEEVGYVQETTTAVLDDLRRWGESILPALGEGTIIRSWAGLRPGVFDGLPYLGKLPGLENAFAATGHYRAGIHLSPATAQLLTQRILQLPLDPPIDIWPFRISRGS